jgi:hypothetical protein
MIIIIIALFLVICEVAWAQSMIHTIWHHDVNFWALFLFDIVLSLVGGQVVNTILFVSMLIAQFYIWFVM